jgi:hypothetical protein
MKDIQSALDHIDRLRPARLNLSATRGFSLRETILLMAPKLTEKRELGFSRRAHNYKPSLSGAEPRAQAGGR